MRAKFIYEKFTEDSDPISDLRIGILHNLKPLTILYCKKYLPVKIKNYTYYYGIKIGQFSIIKDVDIFKNRINLEVSTFDSYPKYITKNDFPFIGGEFLSLTFEEFFEHFTIENVRYKKEGN